jgi:hypothetical protein
MFGGESKISQRFFVGLVFSPFAGIWPNTTTAALEQQIHNQSAPPFLYVKHDLRKVVSCRSFELMVAHQCTVKDHTKRPREKGGDIGQSNVGACCCVGKLCRG